MPIEGSVILQPDTVARKLAMYGYKLQTKPEIKQRLIDYAIFDYYLHVNQSPNINANVYSRFWTPELIRQYTGDLALLDPNHPEIY